MMQILLFLLGCILLQGLYASDKAILAPPIHRITLEKAFELVPPELETEKEISVVSTLIGISLNSLPNDTSLESKKIFLINQAKQLLQWSLSDEDRHYIHVRIKICEWVTDRQFANTFFSIVQNRTDMNAIISLLHQKIRDSKKDFEIGLIISHLKRHIEYSVKLFNTQKLLIKKDGIESNRQTIYKYWIRVFREFFNNNLSIFNICNRSDPTTYPKPLPISIEEGYRLYETLLYSMVLWIGIEKGFTLPCINEVQAPDPALQAARHLAPYFKQLNSDIISKARKSYSYSFTDKKLLILWGYLQDKESLLNLLPLEVMAYILSYVNPCTFKDVFDVLGFKAIRENKKALTAIANSLQKNNPEEKLLSDELPEVHEHITQQMVPHSQATAETVKQPIQLGPIQRASISHTSFTQIESTSTPSSVSPAKSNQQDNIQPSSTEPLQPDESENKQLSDELPEVFDQPRQLKILHSRIAMQILRHPVQLGSTFHAFSIEDKSPQSTPLLQETANHSFVQTITAHIRQAGSSCWGFVQGIWARCFTIG